MYANERDSEKRNGFCLVGAIQFMRIRGSLGQLLFFQAIELICRTNGNHY